MKNKIEIQDNTQFFKDMKKSMRVNKGIISKAQYNLILTRRDLRLHLKGIKPHKGFTLRNVKKYFGIKGDAKKLLDTIILLIQIFKGEK